MSAPLAYFISFHTYGTWLHGRNEGSVDRQHNVPGTPLLPANPKVEAATRASMRQAMYTLDEPRRAVVLRTIMDVAVHRRWRVLAAHVRMNHVHTVVQSPDRPEKVMADLKAWASRRLRAAFDEPADRDRWTQHGSTRWINHSDDLEAAIKYVIDEQGEKMACYDSRNEPDSVRAGSVSDVF